MAIYLWKVYQLNVFNFLNNMYVSDCCLADYKLKTFYDRNGNIVRDVALDYRQKEATCLKCFKDCSAIRKPKN